ncbi:MAG: metal-sensing transcriptional repressor [Bacilli bacterium]|jgi:DNA-binding FrmR family transcriptional regulator|nr:metal-sensing transcriptional repressor [Acholeplasmataceae bacterium]
MQKHQNALKTIKVASGQIQSVAKMIEEDRYCMDISMQIQATISLLKKAQATIIGDHLNTCVVESIEQNDANLKVEEINALIKSILK